MTITSDEILDFFQGEVPEETLEKFRASDKDGDGVITFAEFDGPKGEGQDTKVDYSKAKFKFEQAEITEMPITEEMLRAGPMGEGFQSGDDSEATPDKDADGKEHGYLLEDLPEEKAKLEFMREGAGKASADAAAAEDDLDEL